MILASFLPGASGRQNSIQDFPTNGIFTRVRRDCWWLNRPTVSRDPVGFLEHGRPLTARKIPGSGQQQGARGLAQLFDSQMTLRRLRIDFQGRVQRPKVFGEPPSETPPCPVVRPCGGSRASSQSLRSHLGSDAGVETLRLCSELATMVEHRRHAMWRLGGLNIVQIEYEVKARARLCLKTRILPIMVQNDTEVGNVYATRAHG